MPRNPTSPIRWRSHPYIRAAQGSGRRCRRPEQRLRDRGPGAGERLDGGARAPKAVVRVLDPALRLWRGEALADVADIAELAPTCPLDEVRTELTETYAKAQPALGRPAAAIPPLAAARTRNPLQESIVRLHALALRDSGRTPEALDTLLHLRRDLADQVGLDPPPETLRVEQEIRQPDAPAGRRVHPRRPRGGGRRPRPRMARDTHGLTVVEVRGQGGIGKTALIDDALHRHGATAYYASGVDGGAPLQTSNTWIDQAALDGLVEDSSTRPRTLARMLADRALTSWR